MATLTGTDGPDTLDGTPDADLISGLGGADTIQGEFGDDSIEGGVGADRLYGDDRLRGPLPSDLGPPGTPQPGNNTVLGSEGDDTVYAGYGSDQVFGGAGDDVLTGSGSYEARLLPGAVGIPGFAGSTTPIDRLDGPDLLEGEDGNDLLEGGAGADTLRGGAGDDALAGGFGADLLTGGPGADSFDVRLFLVRFDGRGNSLPEVFFGNGFALGIGPGERDMITDFTQGEDHIGLGQYLSADRDVAGPGTAVFLGTGAFLPVRQLPNQGGVPAIQIRTEVEADGGHTLIQFFTPGFNDRDATEGRVDGEIELIGAYRLTAADFANFGGVTDRSLGLWDSLAAEVQANHAATGQWFTDLSAPGPPPRLVDWNALAAQVEASHAATGAWFVAGSLPFQSSPAPPEGWDALAAQAQANFAATGHWFL